MLKKFFQKAAQAAPVAGLPPQSDAVERVLADIQAHSELAAKAAVNDDWVEAYRHRYLLKDLRAALAGAIEAEKRGPGQGE